MQFTVQLIQGQDGVPVEARIVELAQKHVDDYENFWREQLGLFLAEDKYWDWLFKLQFTSSQENHESYALECLGLTQGLMMVETQLHGSRAVVGKRLVYIEAITSAPWNRKEIQRLPRFQGVGAVLLRYARLRSVELGYEGRVGLHSLSLAERFYEKQGMFNYGPEEDYDNLTYFEYGPLQQRQE